MLSVGLMLLVIAFAVSVLQKKYSNEYIRKNFQDISLGRLERALTYIKCIFMLKI